MRSCADLFFHRGLSLKRGENIRFVHLFVLPGSRWNPRSVEIAALTAAVNKKKRIELSRETRKGATIKETEARDRGKPRAWKVTAKQMAEALLFFSLSLSSTASHYTGCRARRSVERFTGVLARWIQHDRPRLRGHQRSRQTVDLG